MKNSTVPKLLLIFFLLLHSTTHSNSQASISETFLQCLDRQPTDPASPNSRAAYIPNNSSFPTILRNYIRNLRFAKPTTPKPLAIVAAATMTHVQAALGCCRDLSVQVRIRSGGHDFEGLSYVSTVPFIILDMFNMRSIDINMTDATAWVGSGSTTGELYYRIAQQSNVHGFPAGVCTTLGTGGHFSGGGYGNLMRKYGLSVDNIVGAQIVDSNGNIYMDRTSMGEDIFWAIRGGGAASFGVVLAWKIKLVTVPEKVTVFNVERTLEDGAVDLIWKWQDFAYKTDRKLFVRLMLSSANRTEKGKKTVKASFTGMYLDRNDRLLSLMKRSFPELKLHKTDCVETKWIESVVFWAGYPKGTPTSVLLNRIPANLMYLKRKSDYVKRPISKSALNLITKKIMEIEKVSMAWSPYGGRMSEIRETATPFPHRAGNIFKIQYIINWSEGGDDIEKDYLDNARKMYDVMKPYVSKNPREAFLNYRDIAIGKTINFTYEEGKVYGVKYFKNNFERLVKIKSMSDPGNFFRNEQSIPVRRR